MPDLWLAARHEPLPSWLAALSSHADLSGVVVPGPGIHALAAPDYRASVCDNLAPSHPAARMAQLRPPTSAGIVLAANAGIRPGAAPGVPVSVRVVGVAGVAGERRVRTAIGRTNPRPEIDDLRAPPSYLFRPSSQGVGFRGGRTRVSFSFGQAGGGAAGLTLHQTLNPLSLA